MGAGCTLVYLGWRVNSAVLLTVTPQHRCGVGAGGGVGAAETAAQLCSRQGCAASCCGSQTAPPASPNLDIVTQT